MMNHKENTRPAGETEQVQGNYDGQVATDDCNITPEYNQHEQALLRGLMGAPAGSVVKILNSLCDHDFYGPDNLTIFHAVLTAAHRLVDEGQSEAPVSPVRVQLDLQQAGTLSHGETARALTSVGTGTPPAWPDIEALAGGLKQARLRRAMATVGDSLTRGAQGGLEDIKRSLVHADRLREVARRAGIDTHQRWDAAKRRRDASLRMQPLDNGARDPLHPATDAPARKHRPRGIANG